MGSIPGLGRSPGEGNGNPLQYSCLGNPMDRGAWRATAHGSQRVRDNQETKHVLKNIMYFKNHNHSIHFESWRLPSSVHKTSAIRAHWLKSTSDCLDLAGCPKSSSFHLPSSRTHLGSLLTFSFLVICLPPLPLSPKQKSETVKII